MPLTSTYRKAVTFTTGLFVGLAIGTAAGGWIADAHADTPLEDEPGFSCVDDGNHVCGPDNANGAPAGCYDEGGVLVAAWPCDWVTYGFEVDGVERQVPVLITTPEGLR